MFNLMFCKTIFADHIDWKMTVEALEWDPWQAFLAINPIIKVQQQDLVHKLSLGQLLITFDFGLTFNATCWHLQQNNK